MEAEELIAGPGGSREEVAPVDGVRAFVFLAGMRWLREQGYDERVRKLIPPDLYALANNLAAGEWVPIADALTIYGAIDELAMPLEHQIEIGRTVAIANNGVVLSTLARLAGKLGASPFLVFERVNAIWARNNRGGAIVVYRLAERSVRMEFWACPLARSPFFRTSMGGSLGAGLEPFARDLRVAELPEHRTENSFALRLSWA